LTSRPNKHRDLISIEREADQEVRVTIGQTTAGGREIDGGYSQLFNRVMNSGIYADLPLAARAVYTALVYLADNQRQFMIDGRDGSGVNVDRIMKVSGCGETAVKQSMKVLADRQLLRVLRKGGSEVNGTRVASIYQLLLPVAGYEHLSKAPANRSNASVPGHATTRYPGASRPGTVARPDPVPGREPTPNPSASRPATRSPNVHSSRKETRNVDRPAVSGPAVGTTTAESSDELRSMLAARGVREPVLSRIVSDHSRDDIRAHVLDFDLRNKLPGTSKKNAGWLAQSILIGYDLHEKTQRQLDTARRTEQASEARRRAEQLEADEADRQARLDEWTEEAFAALDDDELNAWKRKVLEEYASLPKMRDLGRADPRENERLSRLIKGLLVKFAPAELLGAT
jgi:hypothetical protein